MIMLQTRGEPMTTLTTLRRRYARGEGGSVSIMMAVSLVPMLLAAGAAVDYAQSIGAKAQLQAAADIAALAGTTDSDRPDERRLENAERAFAANFTAPVLDPATVITLNGRLTRVEASATVPTSLTKLMGLSGIEVHVIAEATATEDPVCLVSLENSDKEAVYLNSDSKIIAPDCIARVNSSHGKEALFGNSKTEMDTKSTCVVGGYRANSGATFDPTPETECAVFDDPLAWLPAPPEASQGCTHNDIVVQNGEVRSFAPGVYCKKLEINSGGKATFEPGIHVIRDTEFKVNSGSQVSGDGVMFYLTGEKGRLNFNSDSVATFSPPASGTAGIVFFQERTAKSDYHIINSRSSSVIEGVIYFPNADLHINSEGTLGINTPWWALLVRKLKLNSDSTLHINVNDTSSSAPRPKGLSQRGTVRLIR
jgi:hypothetical protein